MLVTRDRVESQQAAAVEHPALWRARDQLFERFDDLDVLRSRAFVARGHDQLGQRADEMPLLVDKPPPRTRSAKPVAPSKLAAARLRGAPEDHAESIQSGLGGLLGEEG